MPPGHGIPKVYNRIKTENCIVVSLGPDLTVELVFMMGALHGNSSKPPSKMMNADVDPIGSAFGVRLPTLLSNVISFSTTLLMFYSSKLSMFYNYNVF